ncbi:MAG: methyltransferase domain-containing protein [Planctomycetes bacterium]|nr:methyltransferase domain-containing protein [Planctomycetota bacterium]
MTKHADELRESVSREYSAMLQAGASAPSAPTGAAAYEAGDLQGVPAEAQTGSFGCGNPVAFSGVRPGDVVVDLGCGGGLDLILASRKTGAAGRVIGVDMTDEMLALARRNLSRAGVHDNVDLRKGIIEALPIDSDSVDWVLSNCVVNLSPEKPRVFSENRMCRTAFVSPAMARSPIFSTRIPRPSAASTRSANRNSIAGLRIRPVPRRKRAAMRHDVVRRGSRLRNRTVERCRAGCNPSTACDFPVDSGPRQAPSTDGISMRRFRSLPAACARTTERSAEGSG